jgi:uncharacterized protein (DUF362 family)/Pyruvate/2-oxoacid:ferredoxin oxidoreductase delta subunit
MSDKFSLVSIKRCSDYRSENIHDLFEKILSPLGTLPLRFGDRVLLKPNCLSAHHGPDQPVNTRAEIVEAVGRYLLKHYPIKLLIADSSGMGSYGKSKRVYALMGLDRVAANLGADLVNLEDFGLCECHNPEGRIITDFKATALLEQVEAIINIPKLKTHILTGVTGAVKNVLGLLPGSLKRDVHVAAPTGVAMAKALVDIYGGIKRKVSLVLHVLDGITAMEGMGPSKGKAHQAGWILAATDPVAIDAVGATVMGFQPARIKIITQSAAAGFGVFDKAHINLIGATWEELPITGFRHPFTRSREWVEGFIPRSWLGWAFDRLNEAKPNIRAEGCLRCGQCLEACPARALQLTEKGLQLNRDLCIECYCCLEHCPHDGLWVHRGLWERIKRRHEMKGHLNS